MSQLPSLMISENLKIPGEDSVEVAELMVSFWSLKIIDTSMPVDSRTILLCKSVIARKTIVSFGITCVPWRIIFYNKFGEVIV